MTQREIQIIINSNIPSYEKSRLIQELIDAKNANVKSLKEGGKNERLEPDTIVEIEDKEYYIVIADTPEKRKEGLSKCKNLPEDTGMLFVFDEPSTDYFTMAGTDIDLDIVFMDEDGEVLEVHSVEARDPEPVVCSTPYMFVLEVNINSGIQVGDEMEEEDNDFSEEEKEQISKSKMLVLNSDGDVQYRLEGGERICSMIFTRKLIKTALKAYKTDSDTYYRKVGEMIFKEFTDQDNRAPQFVSAPK